MEIQPIHVQLLQRHHLFSSLGQEEFETLLKTAQLINLAKDKTLFWQGDKAEHFYFVLSGTIKLYRLPPDGSEKIIEVLTANQSFAEAIMFMKTAKFVVTAQTLEKSQVIRFRNSDYLSLLESNISLAFAVLGSMSMRLHRRIEEIETLSLKNAAHRVVRYLLTQAYESQDEQPVFQIPHTKRLAAAQLSIQPETFSRVIHKLHDDGVIHLEGRQVTILDKKKLEVYE